MAALRHGSNWLPALGVVLVLQGGGGPWALAAVGCLHGLRFVSRARLVDLFVAAVFLDAAALWTASRVGLDDPLAYVAPVALSLGIVARSLRGSVAPVLVDAPAIFVSAGYRLAPEHKFPAPLEDAFAALQWVDRNIADHGGDPNRIFAAGWSVGGTLAALITLRRELYAGWDLPDGIVKACFAACAGFAYRADVLAPGDGGLTYGDLLYDRPGAETLASPLDHVGGNRTPFYISHASGDFEHVRRSSAAMAEALAREGCVVEYDVFEGLDPYQRNLAHGAPHTRRAGTVRARLRPRPRT